jgi:hypothetical protein
VGVLIAVECQVKAGTERMPTQEDAYKQKKKKASESK